MFTAAHVLLFCHSMHFNLWNVDGAKTLFIVAPVTGVTELPMVNIVPSVTIKTKPVFGTGLFLRFCVTGMAMKISVCVPELERSFVMIEIPDQPGVGVMA